MNASREEISLKKGSKYGKVDGPGNQTFTINSLQEGLGQEFYFHSYQ